MTLKTLSLIYLAAPWFLFLSGWLKPGIAIAAVVILSSGIGFFLRDLKKDVEVERDRRHRFHYLVFVLGFSVLWTSLSGAGGQGMQEADWTKHNAIFKTLVTSAWPATIEIDGKAVPLVYYIGYYLPAAAVGKWLGWYTGQTFLFAYSAAGVALGLFWIGRLVPAGRFLAVPMFAVSGGLDVIARMFIGQTPYHPFEDVTHWSQHWISASTCSDLFHSPQHAVPGWILTGFVLHEGLKHASGRGTLLLLALGCLWSPLVCIGLLPFVLVTLYQTRPSAFTIPNGCAFPLLLIVGAFLSANGFQIPKGWAWQSFDANQLAPRYALFCLSSFGMFAILCHDRTVAQGQGRGWFWVAVLWLMMTPLYYFGLSWDFTMRASIASLVIVKIVVIRNILSQPRRSRLLAAAWLIGTAPALAQLARSIHWYQSQTPSLDLTPALSSVDLSEQYAGRQDGFFFRHLAERSDKSVEAR